MGEFNPQEHLIRIRGEEYLEVKWRLVWLRQDHPDWTVSTEILDRGDPVLVRATITDAGGRLVATGHAEYPRGRPFPSVMKCETSALGRALAHAGYGTQFAGEDVQEPEMVDAPVVRPAGGGRTNGAVLAPPPDGRPWPRTERRPPVAENGRRPSG